LLDEATERAEKLIADKNPDLSAEERASVVNAVAMGSVKYSDLSKNRTTDYIFDWENMLSFEGNTAPYMQYAYTRVSSIFKRANIDESSLTGNIILNDDREKALAIKLMQFEEAVYSVVREGEPHLMCAYLYELAGLFSSFYEACPILNQEDQDLRNSRLKLASLTAKTLKQGLDLLGIDTVERM
ncbi:MAG: arginine--tRNA ligase, partial [Plesiomonas sp.]